MDADGDAVIAWQSNGQDGSGYGIYGQRFNAAGLKVGGEFPINTFTTERPEFSVGGGGRRRRRLGRVAELWPGRQRLTAVYGQRFNSAGAKVGGEFQINTYTTSFQQSPSVAVDADGDVFVAWESSGQDGSGYGVYGQRFRSPNPPAKVSNIQVNDGSAQRSMVTSLQITFDSRSVSPATRRRRFRWSTK